MIFSNYPFTLDIHNTLSQVSIPVTLGDTARQLCISLTDGGKPYIIADGCRATLVGKKADGKSILHDCIIEKNKDIRYYFTEQTATAIGKTDCQILLYGEDGKLIACPRFTMVVYKDVMGVEMLSENELLSIGRILAAEEARVAAENERVAAEKERAETLKNSEQIISEINEASATAKAEVETAESEAVDHLNSLAEGAYDISQVVGQSTTQVMSQKTTTDYLTPLETIFVPQYSGTLYFEGDTNGFNPLYFKFSSLAHQLFLRGFYVTAQFTMQNIIDTLPNAIVTSPKGVEGCLKIDHNYALVWDRNANAVALVLNTANAATQIPIFKVSSGRVVGGIGLSVYDNYCADKAITDMKKFKDVFAVKPYESDYYFEGDTNSFSDCYFKSTPVPSMAIHIRGVNISVSSTMQQFIDDLPEYIVTSPKGVKQCLKIPHNSYLVYDTTTKKYAMVGYPFLAFETQIPIFFASTGAVQAGIGKHLYDTYITKTMCEEVPSDNDIASYFVDEIEDCSNKLVESCTSKSLVFCLVTDSHYGVEASFKMWENTRKNINAINNTYKLDAIYHLGDLVDGNLTKEETTAHISKMRNDMYAVNPETYILAGNHEDNSFTANHEYQYTKAELYSILCRFKDVDTVRPSNKLYWYKDMHTMGIRVICLDSHMGEGTYGSGTSWGYPQEVVDWVRDTALNTSYQVVFLSHMPVTGAFNAYGLQPVNGIALRNVIENFKANGGTVIGLFHGHTHWDFLGKANANGFYEVSTGCSINGGTYVPDYAPEGATFPVRGGGVANDLWDIVVIQPTERKVKMIRFGAGNDREFTY